MPTIDANGLRIAYEQIGSGPPLVLLHGATTTSRASFAAQIPALAASFELILPDARGHGATRWDVADGFRAEWLVDDLEALADALGLATFHLAGYSMGGMTALGFAVRAPGRLRTLAVAAIATGREPRTSVTRRLMDPARILRDDPGWAAEMAMTMDATQGPGAWQRLLPAIAADVAAQPLLTPAELRLIDAPTLVMCGDRDPLVPVGEAWQLSRQVRDGRLFVAPEAGHDVLARRPALANEAMRGFYRATETIARARADRHPDDRPEAAR
jgi:pimeloyl-ACP methyl ester carboxylesterase